MEQLQPISEQRSEQILKGAANGCRILQAVIGRSWLKQHPTLSAAHHANLGHSQNIF